MTLKKFIPFLCISGVIHAVALAGLTLALPDQTGVIGAQDGDPDRVFVVMVSDQDVVAVAPVPSPMDAPDSKESKPEEDKEIREPVEPEPREPEAQDLLIAQEEKPVEKEKEKSTESTPQTASDAQVSRTTLGREIKEFQARLLAAIRQATYFPQQALNENRHGEVGVTFVINRDGTLSSVRVTNSSGNSLFDEAAQDILRRASKAFPAFPASIGKDSLQYDVPIHFQAKKTADAKRNVKTP
ncbi:MAG: TonB family protein [Pseudomonadota bacterium]